MGSFGKSFSETFDKALTQSVASSSAATGDLIKERIKDEQTKAEEKLKATTFLHNTVAVASQLPDKDMAKKIMDIAEAAGTSSSDIQKNINEMVMKQLAPPMNVFTVGQSGALTSAGQVPTGSKVFRQALTAEEVGARSNASREATTENPQIDQTTQGAIAALEFSKPRLENALSILDKIGKKDFEKLSTQIQIGANNEFLVPNGSPLEDLVAELNDVKVTGFGIAGSAYSKDERKVVEGGLSPIAKGFDRFKRDLVRNRDFFSARAKAGTMGLKEARKIAADSNVYSAGSIPKYDSKTQKLQQNSKGEYRVVPK